MTFQKRPYPLILLAVLAFLVLAGGCQSVSPPRLEPVGADNPEHQVGLGRQFLEEGRLTDALAAFDRALAMDRRYSPAHVGQALVYLARDEKRPQGKSVPGEENSLAAIQKAIETASKESQHEEARLARMRVYSFYQPVGWLAVVEDDFRWLSGRSPERAEVYYLMAVAEEKAGQAETARNHYRQAASLGGVWGEKAKARLEGLASLKQAGTGQTPKEVSRLTWVSRAQTAAFIWEKLKALEEAGWPKRMPRAAFMTPAEHELVQAGPGFHDLPPDAFGHPLAEDMAAVQRLGLRGLAPWPDRFFRPDQPLSRLELALVLEDLYVLLTGSAGVSSAFVGQASPFSDLPPGHFGFNAAVFSVRRGRIRTGPDGCFDPQGRVSGLELVRAWEGLRSELAPTLGL